MIQIFLAILLGLFFGCITGCIPGLHPNTVSLIILSLSPLLLKFTSPLILALFIVTVATSNSFIDTIPSIFLGAPDEGNTALSVLPGHQLLLKGRGYEAVFLTIIGSLAGLILAIALMPLLISTLNFIFPLLKNNIALILIIVVLILFLREKSKSWPIIIFFLSGILGLVTFSLKIKNPLFPLFSGLFGISALLLSIKNKVKIPKQKITTPKIKPSSYKAVIVSLFSGSLVSILPGLGNSQAAILGNSLIKESNIEQFLIMIGGINTVNFVMSFVSLYILDKARNGAIVVISQILELFNLNHLLLFISTTLIVGGISTILTILISKMFSKYISKVKYGLICLLVIIFIVIMVFLLSGFLGFLVLIIATSLGLLPPLKNIARSHLMGCLILPVILYFIL